MASDQALVTKLLRKNRELKKDDTKTPFAYVKP